MNDQQRPGYKVGQALAAITAIALGLLIIAAAARGLVWITTGA